MYSKFMRTCSKTTSLKFPRGRIIALVILLLIYRASLLRLKVGIESVWYFPIPASALLQFPSHNPVGVSGVTLEEEHQYLYQGSSKPVYISLQQDTFKIQPQKACLDVYLADGRNIRLDIQTSDTAERILEVASYKMGLSRELIRYFSLFFIQDHNSGTVSVVKKVAEFELPYVSLQSMKELHCKLGIRKWYMDPALDKMLLDCRASVNLLYMQAVQEIERNWVKPTDEQMQKLELLQKTANKMKFLELVSEVQHYGYIKLDPCTCDYPEVGCSADVHVGNNEIYCCVKLPTNQTKVISFKINRVRCWQVTFLGAVTDSNGEGTDETLELRFEYNDSDTWKWIVFYTKQAFLLSSCFKKMISEQLMKTTKEQELQIEVPESSKSKNSSMQQNQISGFIPRKRMFVKPNEEDRVFEKIREEDL